ncbi:hypothetical protein GCM10010308_13130 [Streptomyces vinaceusdrappus]|nr:hypothetical protein GCM10010301_20380 [Streptomyces plicatus]GHC02283.1 hypothetical protein GCM10010308_13130 [Streptomyces vinaceusdrappus]
MAADVRVGAVADQRVHVRGRLAGCGGGDGGDGRQGSRGHGALQQQASAGDCGLDGLRFVGAAHAGCLSTGSPARYVRHTERHL